MRELEVAVWRGGDSGEFVTYRVPSAPIRRCSTSSPSFSAASIRRWPIGFRAASACAAPARCWAAGSRVRDVHWLDELGIAQAMWVFEVENFGPLLVDCDRAGNSLFEAHNREMKATIEAAYEGLEKPALGRFGETDDRGEELI